MCSGSMVSRAANAEEGRRTETSSCLAPAGAGAGAAPASADGIRPRNAKVPTRMCFVTMARIKQLSPDEAAHWRANSLPKKKIFLEAIGIVTDTTNFVARGNRYVRSSTSGCCGSRPDRTCGVVKRLLYNLVPHNVVPRPRDQFFEPQPARKSRTSSPGLNRAAGAVFRDSALLLVMAS